MSLEENPLRQLLQGEEYKLIDSTTMFSMDNKTSPVWPIQQIVCVLPIGTTMTADQLWDLAWRDTNEGERHKIGGNMSTWCKQHYRFVHKTGYPFQFFEDFSRPKIGKRINYKTQISPLDEECFASYRRKKYGLSQVLWYFIVEKGVIDAEAIQKIFRVNRNRVILVLNTLVHWPRKIIKSSVEPAKGQRPEGSIVGLPLPETYFLTDIGKQLHQESLLKPGKLFPEKPEPLTPPDKKEEYSNKELLRVTKALQDHERALLVLDCHIDEERAEEAQKNNDANLDELIALKKARALDYERLVASWKAHTFARIKKLEEDHEAILKGTYVAPKEVHLRDGYLEASEGYLIALHNLEEFVRVIQNSSNREEARVKLMAFEYRRDKVERYGIVIREGRLTDDWYAISEGQANVILHAFESGTLVQPTERELKKVMAGYATMLKSKPGPLYSSLNGSVVPAELQAPRA